jgi:hypothetical protein
MTDFLHRPIQFDPGDLALACRTCHRFIGRIQSLPDGTPAEPPRFPHWGKCARCRQWVELVALDPVTQQRAA